MKFVSWNVNGIRACMKTGIFETFFDKENADFFCIQETKLSNEIVLEKNGYLQFWNNSKRKGYSGTAIFCKRKPLNVEYGLKDEYGENIDFEGRLITLEYRDFYLINCYTPNSKNGKSRVGFRTNWDEKFRRYIEELNKKKYVIIGGDFNVSHTLRDMCKDYRKNIEIPFEETERNAFDELLKSDLIDTYRFFHPQFQKYTWWCCSDKKREDNLGWRLDYFLISQDLKKNIRKADIYTDVLGSDHCPIELELVNI